MPKNTRAPKESKTPKEANTPKETRREIRIEAIENGTVIDHIPAGKALAVIGVLRLEENATAGIAINVPSKKLGRKDLIFVADKELSSEEAAKISLVAKNATLNIIRDHSVARKEKISLPSEVRGIIRCINPNCITNHESVATRFLLRENPLKATCYYCEREMLEGEILQAIK